MGCAQSNVQAAGPADKLVPQDLPPPKEQKAAAGGGDAKAADKVKVGVNVDCPGTHASSQETSRINSGGTHGESSRRAIPQAERRPSWSAGGNSMTAGTMEVGYIGTKNSEGLMHGKGTMWFEVRRRSAGCLGACCGRAGRRSPPGRRSAWCLGACCGRAGRRSPRAGMRW